MSSSMQKLLAVFQCVFDLKEVNTLKESHLFLSDNKFDHVLSICFHSVAVFELFFLLILYHYLQL